MFNHFRECGVIKHYFTLQFTATTLTSSRPNPSIPYIHQVIKVDPSTVVVALLTCTSNTPRWVRKVRKGKERKRKGNVR